MQGHPNKGTEKKNTGFPLTTGGNDRGGTRGYDREGPAGMTESTRGYDREGPAGMTEGDPRV